MKELHMQLLIYATVRMWTVYLETVAYATVVMATIIPLGVWVSKTLWGFCALQNRNKPCGSLNFWFFLGAGIPPGGILGFWCEGVILGLRCNSLFLQEFLVCLWKNFLKRYTPGGIIKKSLWGFYALQNRD